MPFIHLKSVTPSYLSYLSALGRALVVCQHLESCAHHVMVVWEITDEGHIGKDIDSLREIALSLRDKPLGASARRLRNSPDFGIERAEALDRGRAARNWIAHESTLMVDEIGDQSDGFAPHLLTFRDSVRDLCTADSILAIASYEIQERQPAPAGISKSYAADLESWILQPVERWLRSG